jgi:ABC-2 type transport system permease protein
MKIIAIALKDLLRSFRSAFALVFMFGIPLLVAAIFYFMFGNNQVGFEVPQTKVVVANLDQGSPQFQAGMEGISSGSESASLGEELVKTLQSPALSNLLSIELAADAGSARRAVDDQKAGTALVIPEGFSASFVELDSQAAVELYSDPTLTLGPAIVRSILNQFIDDMSATKIAVNVAIRTTGVEDPELINQLIQQSLAGHGSENHNETRADLLAVRAPGAAPTKNSVTNIVGPILGGMMIFYAFFTGMSTAESILKEDEERTLPRLFTTPTPQGSILAGKFLSVFLTVMVQVIVLVIAARLIFGIRWGDPLRVAMMAVGTILTAATFGIFVNSLLKTTRQGGVVFGGLLTVTGMLGLVPIFTMGSPDGGGAVAKAAMFVPQGWAVRALFLSMNQAPLGEIALILLGLLGWSAVFFTLGVFRFQKRYA